MTEALIARDDARLAVSFTEKANALKTEALEVAALIGKVTSASEQAEAVKAQAALQNILAQAEKAREACKRPVLDFGRTIDNAAKTFVEELRQEMSRISILIGNFQALEAAKARAVEAQRQKELAEIEKQRLEAAAQAKSIEALDAVNDHFSRKAAESVTPTVQPARVEGQIVRQDWTIEVTDIWLLARSHPTCVKIEPRLSEIKELLKQGAKVVGVNATEITKATFRAGTQVRAIDV